jgi:hypothetical protein
VLFSQLPPSPKTSLGRHQLIEWNRPVQLLRKLGDHNLRAKVEGELRLRIAKKSATKKARAIQQFICKAKLMTKIKFNFLSWNIFPDIFSTHVLWSRENRLWFL